MGQEARLQLVDARCKKQEAVYCAARAREHVIGLIRLQGHLLEKRRCLENCTEESFAQSALNKGPVSVAIEADQNAFQGYSGGVITSGCGTNLDHGVTAVGYTSSYFIVKNSWGTSWGDAGYVNIGSSGNVCGIHSDASYPTVSGSVQV